MKTARRKGHDFERDIARQFREELGFTDAMTKREARGGDWSNTDDGADLAHTWPYAVQCKRLQTYASISAIEEIVTDDEVPLLLTKANGKPTMAVLPWAELKKLLKRP